jgi:L,D-transpeptidase ErfK/SrfK
MNFMRRQSVRAYPAAYGAASLFLRPAALRAGAFSPTQKLTFMRIPVTLALLLYAGSVTAQAASDSAPAPLNIYHLVTGEEVVHVVVQGDTLGHIAGRFGMSTRLAAVINRLADPGKLHLGQRLVLSNRHIVPQVLQDGLVINVGDLMLYWMRDGDLVAAFPVGVGRVAWETPSGHYSIVGRRRDPVWHVPPTIQREMREKGEPVKRVVPPGPDNPLGKYWLQLSLSGYGIHGTNAPRSVGKYTTHGCIRLRPDDEDRLYHGVSNGTAVDIINEPIKLARLEGDMVLLEVHPSASSKLAAAFLQQLHESEVAAIVDFAAVQRVVHDAWGLAVDVSNKKAGRCDACRSGAADRTGTP